MQKMAVHQTDGKTIVDHSGSFRLCYKIVDALMERPVGAFQGSGGLATNREVGPRAASQTSNNAPAARVRAVGMPEGASRAPAPGQWRGPRGL
jgi:hypothetical protein